MAWPPASAKPTKYSRAMPRFELQAPPPAVALGWLVLKNVVPAMVTALPTIFSPGRISTNQPFAATGALSSTTTAVASNRVAFVSGAAKAVSLVLPQLKGKLDGLAVRVPTPNVSLIDLVVEVERDTTEAEVNGLLKQASEQALKGVLATHVGERLNLVNAPLVAKERGIKVVDAKSSTPKDFASLVTVELRGTSAGGAQRRVDIRGALFGNAEARIVGRLYAGAPRVTVA